MEIGGAHAMGKEQKTRRGWFSFSKHGDGEKQPKKMNVFALLCGVHKKKDKKKVKPEIKVLRNFECGDAAENDEFLESGLEDKDSEFSCDQDSTMLPEFPMAEPTECCNAPVVLPPCTKVWAESAEEEILLEEDEVEEDQESEDTGIESLSRGEQEMTVAIRQKMDVAVVQVHAVKVPAPIDEMKPEDPKSQEMISLALESIDGDPPSLQMVNMVWESDEQPSLALTTQVPVAKAVDTVSMGSVKGVEIVSSSCETDDFNEFEKSYKSYTAECVTANGSVRGSRATLTSVTAPAVSSISSSTTSESEESESETASGSEEDEDELRSESVLAPSIKPSITVETKSVSSTALISESAIADSQAYDQTFYVIDTFPLPEQSERNVSLCEGSTLEAENKTEVCDSETVEVVGGEE